MTKHVKLTITGRVQGVGFRYHARSQAFRLGLRGIVKNMTDGSLYIEVEGEPMSINAFIEWCWNGPPHAQVENVAVTPGQIKEYKTFEILK